MDLLLSGKRALIVGGSKGIGLAVATALADEGADLVIAARDAVQLESAAAALRARGARVLPVSADTTDDQSVRALVARMVDEFGGVDILVNAAAEPAAPGRKNTLDQLVDDDLHTEIDTKVLGYLRTARAAAPHMIEQGWGRIVNISGLAARATGNPFGSIRNVAVVAMTKNLADELGKHGINVTVVHPGITVTERTPAHIEQMAERSGVSVAEATAAFGSNNTIGRAVTACRSRRCDRLPLLTAKRRHHGRCHRDRRWHARTDRLLIGCAAVVGAVARERGDNGRNAAPRQARSAGWAALDRRGRCASSRAEHID